MHIPQLRVSNVGINLRNSHIQLDISPLSKLLSQSLKSKLYKTSLRFITILAIAYFVIVCGIIE